MENKKIIAKNKKIEKYLLNLQNGDKKAYLYLGNLYDEGKEVAKDKVKALRFYQMAAIKMIHVVLIMLAESFSNKI